MTQKKEIPITWFPSSADRKNWSDEIGRIQSLKQKQQAAAHAANIALQNLELKKQIAKKAANKPKPKTKK